MMGKSQEPPRRPDPWDPEERRKEILRNLRELHSLSNRGIWCLCLFIAISIGALWDFEFLPDLPEKARELLGAAPSSNWISVALVVYSFSALVLTLSRMMSGTGARDGLAHVGYLTGFYGFYHFAGSLKDNFWAVFAAGMTVLGLEAYNLWNHTSERIGEEMERLESLEKREKPPEAT